MRVDGSEPGGFLGAALLIAAAAHDGQVDKAGRPYLAHPLRMVARALSEFHDPDVAIVAALHDVVEDSVISLHELRTTGFKDRVVGAIEALTRCPNEPYPEFLQRCRANLLAATVKMLDVEDNCDPARLTLIIDAEVRARLVAKYALARQVLMETQSG